jgi:hypothetical protein
LHDFLFVQRIILFILLCRRELNNLNHYEQLRPRQKYKIKCRRTGIY